MIHSIHPNSLSVTLADHNDETESRSISSALRF